MKYLITSESVSEGHPDKMCDQISDAILDACLKEDPESRVACECLVTTGTIIVSWEITTNAWVNFQDIARKVVREIWYDSLEAWFSADDASVQILINSQSPDIAQWVNTGWAGDQWIMFWYATNETDNYLPLSISLAHKLIKKLEEVRKTKVLDYLLPDAKSQVTVEFENDKPIRVDTIVVSNQHKASVSLEELKKWIIDNVIKPVVWDLMDENTKLHINPTGRFVVGWPKWDCWLTWRKIIVDTYGWLGRHWGWAFSWKDPSKVDRSGAYIARYIAKNIVASWVCDKCEVQLWYAIWVAQPVSVYLNTFDTEKVSIEKIIDAIKNNFDLSPNGIIKTLDLKKPIYQKTATGWHFGRDDVSWEKLDKKEVFEELLK
jgi:S-adenosylmethionine synthetase